MKAMLEDAIKSTISNWVQILERAETMETGPEIRGTLVDLMKQLISRLTMEGLVAAERNKRQHLFIEWAKGVFGASVVLNPTERALRFIEEALELSQACGLTLEQVDKVKERVFSRPVGEISQEVGGVGLTLLGLCEVADISAEQEEQRELQRVTAMPADYFRKKQVAKAEAGTGMQPESMTGK